VLVLHDLPSAHKDNVAPLRPLTMAAKTEAQEEFDSILAKASAGPRIEHHPADDDDFRHDGPNSDRDEDEAYAQRKVDENMRFPTLDRRGSGMLSLPHPAFDSGRTTGVKGVIADARSYEEARQSGGWRHKFSRSVSAEKKASNRLSTVSLVKQDGDDSASEDEQFLERWREQRRVQLESEGNDIRNRRTSPSVRRFGRFDEVDALGYLDAIEKVGRETVVVVFVYDPEVRSNNAASNSVQIV